VAKRKRTKEEIIIYHTQHRKSKDRQHGGQTKGDKRTNNNLQNTTQKIINYATGTPLKPG
jgi:hypothetical protein